MSELNNDDKKEALVILFVNFVIKLSKMQKAMAVKPSWIVTSCHNPCEALFNICKLKTA